MISREKVKRMTDVAMLKKKERSNESDVCKFKRKDYVALHMFAVWLSSSSAYLILTAGLLLFILGKNPEQYIALDTIGQVAFLWGMVYLVYCMVFCWIAYLRYSAKYVRARGWQMRYHRAVQALEDYYYNPVSQEREDEWLTETEEGNSKQL